jgi:hypothetical protein
MRRARNGAPTGLSVFWVGFPGLTAWANEWRAYGAGLIGCIAFVAKTQRAGNGAPTGLAVFWVGFPGLTAWANECRAYGAGLRAQGGCCQDAGGEKWRPYGALVFGLGSQAWRPGLTNAAPTALG